MTQTFDLVLKNGTVVNQDGVGIRDIGVLEGGSPKSERLQRRAAAR